ncbi:MAG: TusE/DsrC/DsvC family sulfur relay protein [Gammaproteobacteria bacterium]|nr:TusE/DsrC/DsvC family sulfur relay protein [Gammaproteobacteria bacterium]
MLETDGDGFLLNRDEWSEQVMHDLAKKENFALTDDHIKYILSARQMFEEDGTVPPLRVFAKAHGMDRKAGPLNDLFGGGPMKKIAKFGGLPKPTGCV